MINFA